MSDLKGQIADLPPSPRIHFIREALLKERRMREITLTGSNRDKKVEEIGICLDYLTHIEVALQKAKGAVAEHKEMVAWLEAAAKRHGVEVGDQTADRAIIAALDDAAGFA